LCVKKSAVTHIAYYAILGGAKSHGIAQREPVWMVTNTFGGSDAPQHNHIMLGYSVLFGMSMSRIVGARNPFEAPLTLFH